MRDDAGGSERVSDAPPSQVEASVEAQGPQGGDPLVEPAPPVPGDGASEEDTPAPSTADAPLEPEGDAPLDGAATAEITPGQADEPHVEASAGDSPPEAVIAVVADAAAILEDSAGLSGASPATESDSESEADSGQGASAGSAQEPAPASTPPVSPLVRPLPRVLAIANQKGGVGKTTTAVNLGAALAELGYRVLVVDLDPQGNATTGLGINPRTLEASVYDVIMHDTPLEDCIEPTSLRNLFVVPATIDLAGAEIELVPAFSRELKLRRALESVADDFDYTLIDCPPSLGLITVNGLAAATEVIVPIQCEYYALEGLGQLLRNVSLVQQNLNPKLEVSAIILTMFDARTKLADQVAGEVRSHFGDKVCRNIVPRTVRLSEAPSFGQPIIVFDPSSRGAIAYRELAKEVSGGAPQRVG
jgi:chromosome partitioning protein